MPLIGLFEDTKPAKGGTVRFAEIPVRSTGGRVAAFGKVVSVPGLVNVLHFGGVTVFAAFWVEYVLNFGTVPQLRLAEDPGLQAVPPAFVNSFGKPGVEEPPWCAIGESTLLFYGYRNQICFIINAFCNIDTVIELNQH